MGNKMWFTKSYRRGLMDMHIEDWSDEFMSRYDPKTYVDLLKKANFQSIMIYTNSHIGYCYWPTKSGVEHKCTAGRDILGKFLDYANSAGLDTILYYSLIFNIWAYENHEDWRIKYYDGSYSRSNGKLSLGRAGVCCPNSRGYREFIEKQVKELCENYSFDGIFYDMTFWPPSVCYCDSCKERYDREVGGEIPVTIDWNDPKWIRLQEKREEWLADFADFASKAAKRCRNDISTGHNFATASDSWIMAQNEGVNDACDYTSGDYYGGFAQQSFICKLYRNLTKRMPFEYMTSRCYPNLSSHTNNMTEEMMALHNYITLAHGGAFFYIDAIDPVGTINPAYYKQIGDIYKESQRYEEYLDSQMIADAAIYFNMESKYNKENNGKAPIIKHDTSPHVLASLGISNILRENHIPYTVIGKRNLEDIEKYQLLILPMVLKLNESEKKILQNYVYNGGNIYISGGDILKYFKEEAGLEYVGETKETATFVAPSKEYEAFFEVFDSKYPLAVSGKQAIAKAIKDVDILATITLPYTDPNDIESFASFHSNPPGKPTSHPSITRSKYGKGVILWSASSLESIEWTAHKATMAKLVRLLAVKPFRFEADALPPAEILLLEKPGKKQIIINIVNVQENTPVIPIHDVEIRVKLDGRKALGAVSVRTCQPVGFVVENDYMIFKIEKLHLFDMIMVVYG